MLRASWVVIPVFSVDPNAINQGWTTNNSLGFDPSQVNTGFGQIGGNTGGTGFGTGANANQKLLCQVSPTFGETFRENSGFNPGTGGQAGTGRFDPNAFVNGGNGGSSTGTFDPNTYINGGSSSGTFDTNKQNFFGNNTGTSIFGRRR